MGSANSQQRAFDSGRSLGDTAAGTPADTPQAPPDLGLSRDMLPCTPQQAPLARPQATVSRRYAESALPSHSVARSTSPRVQIAALTWCSVSHSQQGSRSWRHLAGQTTRSCCARLWTKFLSGHAPDAAGSPHVASGLILHVSHKLAPWRHPLRMWRRQTTADWKQQSEAVGVSS